jgi:hypothetical protein
MELLWMIPAYVAGGIGTVYLLARSGRFHAPEDKFSNLIAFTIWPVFIIVETVFQSLTRFGSFLTLVAKAGNKKFLQAEKARKRIKALVEKEEKDKQEAIQLLEKEMEGTALPALTIGQKIRRGIIERGAKDFETAWAEAGQADATPVYVRRLQDNGRFLMTRGTIRVLKADGSFGAHWEEYPAMEEVKT